MAVDAKAILQQNKVLIGLYVFAIVPIVLWVVLVMNGVEGDMSPPPKGSKPSFDKAVSDLNRKKGEIASLIARIKQMKDAAKDHKTSANPVYTPRHTTEYQKRNDDLKKQYDDMANLVKGRQSKLDSWFPDSKIQDEMKNGGLKEPTAGNFKSVFDNEISRLQKEYADLVFDNPTSATKTCFLWQETPTPGALRTFQKKFWIQEQILIAMKKIAADHGVEQLLDKIDFGTGAPPPADPKGGPRFLTPIPVKVVFKGTFRDIPKVLRELLAQDIAFRVTRVRVELLPFSITKGEKEGFEPPGLKVNTEAAKAVYDRPIYEAKLKAGQAPPTDEEAILPEPRLKVTIELEALNFEIDSINSASNPVAEAPPPAKAPEEPPPPPKKPKKKKEDD